MAALPGIMESNGIPPAISPCPNVLWWAVVQATEVAGVLSRSQDECTAAFPRSGREATLFWVCLGVSVDFVLLFSDLFVH